MENTFSRKFTFLEFLKFVLPAIVSMVFISLYTIIDGVFVSNIVGPDALASINIILPLMSFIWGTAIMFSTGGGAIISKFLGKKQLDRANSYLSLFTVFPVIIGLILGLLGFIFIKDLSILLGATEGLLPYSISYGRIICLFTPIFMLKTLLEFFIRADGDFNFSLFISILGGVINIILDYIFIVVFNVGIVGAAWATGLGVLISSFFGILYFFSKKSTLKFTKFKFEFSKIKQALTNGSSEMVTELSTGITTFIFNLLALKYAGENGVAALTIILYAQFFLVATYLGFSTGIAPLISYNHGATETHKLKETFSYSIKFLFGSSIIIFILSRIFAFNLIEIFVKPNSPVFDIALKGLNIFSLSFLFVGFNVFASALFTAFSNGLISSIIAISRALVFTLIGAFILPEILNISGVWLITPFAEFMTLGISLFLVFKFKEIYNY